MSKVLLVSDPFHEQSGKVGEIVALLDEAGVGSSVYTGVTGEPDTVMVETGLEQYVAEGCDGLVALEPDGCIRATCPIGRVLMRNIAAVFDAYLAEDAYRCGEKNSFSANA